MLLALNGCAESMALLGPATSGSFTGGKAVQSAISSATSYAIKQQTGKTPTQHVLAYVKENNPQNTKEKCIDFLESTNSEICSAVKRNILETRDKILAKSKIENLAAKSIQKRRTNVCWGFISS